jgi:hypothetical protein
MPDFQTRVHIARRNLLAYSVAVLALAPAALPCPDLQATLTLPGESRDLAIAGDRLLVGGSLLRLYSLEQPAQPTLIDSLQVGFAPLAIAALDGQERFVILGEDQLSVVRFPAEGPASVMGNLDLGETATSLTAMPGQAWIGLQGGGILPVDLGQPDTPQPGERLDTPGSTLDLLYHDGLVCVADDTSLRIYTALAGGELVLAGQVSPAGSGVAGLTARGNLLVCRQRENGIRVYDISNPAAPVQRTHLDQYLALNSTREMAFAGNDLLLAGRYLFAYDLAQPSQPDLLGITSTRNLRGRALTVLLSRAFVLSSQDGVTASHIEVMYANCNPEADYAFDLVADSETEVGLNGGNAVFELELENLGEYLGHYELSVGDCPWPATLHYSGNGAPLDSIPGLEPNGTFAFELRVAVPEDPEVYTRQVVLTAQSVEDPDRSRSLDLIVQGSCRRLDELPGLLVHDDLPPLGVLGDGEWLHAGEVAWLAPGVPAVFRASTLDGTIESTPFTLAEGSWRGLGWHEGDQCFWISRQDSLVQLTGDGLWLQAVHAPELWPADGGRVAGIGVDEPSDRLWVLLDGPTSDRALVYDLSFGDARLASQTVVDWNLDASAGLSGLDVDEVGHQLLTFGRAGGELECLTDIGGGLVSARGDFCPGGIDSPAGLALSPEGVVYAPFLDGQAFRLRRYSAPCLFTALRPGPALRPGAFDLGSAPNPFNPSTTLRFRLPVAGSVDLSVFNLSGQKVGTLFDGVLMAGEHQRVWTPAGLASGLYLVRLSAEGPLGRDTQWTRVLLLK